MPQAASLLPQTAPDCAAPHVVLAYNPVAGGFSAGLLERLRGAFASAGYVVEATGERTIEPALAERADVVCIVGGDGTARTIVEHNRKLTGRAQICIYPAGTVNLIARERRSPPDPAAFVAHLAPARANSPNRHHTGRITLADGQSRAFLCCASVGPDAEVVARVSPALKRRLGRWAYVAAMAGMLRRWPRRRIAVTVDGQPLSVESLFILKGRYYAGPWVLDEAARLEAGELRVLAMPRAGRRDMLRLALAAIVHPALGDPRWHRLAARQISIATPSPMPVQADGDVLAYTPVTMTIDADPLHFC